MPTDNDSMTNQQAHARMRKYDAYNPPAETLRSRYAEPSQPVAPVVTHVQAVDNVIKQPQIYSNFIPKQVIKSEFKSCQSSAVILYHITNNRLNIDKAKDCKLLHYYLCCYLQGNSTSVVFAPQLIGINTFMELKKITMKRPSALPAGIIKVNESITYQIVL